jgi:DsbC/DsbD-like thiol-disulfide interchange protein
MISAETRRGHRVKPNRDFTGKGALLLVPLLSLVAAPDRALGATGPHGTVDLIAEQLSVRPARPLWVGLHFQLEQGWHIYWANPGDSGQPPRVKWDLPAGFQPGPVQWPIPRRIEDHSLIDYGYQNEVLLPVQIMPPASLGVGPDVQLRATANWLVCREACIPGRAALELTLPIQKGTPGPASAMQTLFARTRADLPQPTPKSWNVTANVDQHLFVLNVDTGKREMGATFFPLEPNQIENAAPQKASPFSRGIRMELQKSDQLLKSPPRLTGVLAFTSGQGYVIDAPVTISK